MSVRWRYSPNSYQPGLGELFRNATPIDFGLGYRWRRNESNLLLAEKIGRRRTGDRINPALTSRSLPGTGRAQTPDGAKNGRIAAENTTEQRPTELGLSLSQGFSRFVRVRRLNRADRAAKIGT